MAQILPFPRSTLKGLHLCDCELCRLDREFKSESLHIQQLTLLLVRGFDLPPEGGSS